MVFFQLASAVLAATSISAAALSIRQTASISSFESSPIAWSYPEGRGFASATADDAPCGGFEVGNRTNYPLTGGDVVFTQLTELVNVNVLYTNESNPSRFHAFDFYSNSITKLGAGHFCTKAPDFSSLGFESGDNATMLVIFQLAADSPFYYQCADISLVESSGYVAPTDDYVCGNYTATLEEASGQDFGGSEGFAHPSVSGYTASSTPTAVASGAANTASVGSASNDGLSAAAGGGIGAAVTLFVVVVLLAVGFFSGLLSFGKKRARSVRGDDASSTSGYPAMKQAPSA